MDLPPPHTILRVGAAKTSEGRSDDPPFGSNPSVRGQRHVCAETSPESFPTPLSEGDSQAISVEELGSSREGPTSAAIQLLPSGVLMFFHVEQGTHLPDPGGSSVGRAPIPARLR